jgi:signal transduction histidine kinase
MFKGLRWSIAAWFVCLSSMVYLALTTVAIACFYWILTAVLDKELKVIASEVGHAIDVRGDLPYFRDWAREVETDPARSLASIQLFDTGGKLLDHYGPKGIEKLLRSQPEAKNDGLSMRVNVSPLTHHGQTVGFMQIQLPTRDRDSSTGQMAIVMLSVAPFVILGLGATGYVVSAKAVRPIEENMEMLKRFVADAGHELNTPLTIAQAKAESFEAKLAKQNLPQEDLKIISSSIGRMAKIVNDLMLLAEIEGPLVTEEKQPVDVCQIVTQVAGEFSERFQEKGVSFKSELKPLSMPGYPDMVYRLISNLLENALRYTETGGEVRIKTSSETNPARLIVEDTGIGIPPDSLPFVFDRFYRVDKSRSRLSGGTGIGLSIVKAIAEAHNGFVSVDSEPGKGSSFIVSLPL